MALRNLMNKIIVILALILLWPGMAVSQSHSPVVGYGSTCRSAMGAPHKHLGINRAFMELQKNFERKGLQIQMISHDRRFIRADILKDSEVIDSIILDTMTGKMRSVY